MASYVPSFFGIVREACLHQQSVAVAFRSETDNLHASPMKVTHPFPWFSILPDDIAEDREDTVASYWSNGDACLLRVSGSGETLGRRFLPHVGYPSGAKWAGLAGRLIFSREIHGCEAAAASRVADHGTTWIPAYLVWLWLSVHVTLSRQGDLSSCEWAWEAI